MYQQPISVAPLGLSDHLCVVDTSFILGTMHLKQSVLVRPLPDSKVREFGQWITTYSWNDVLAKIEVDSKLESLSKISTR